MFVVPAAIKFIPPVASSFTCIDEEKKSGDDSRLTLVDELSFFYDKYNVKFIGGEKDNFVFHIDHISAIFNFMVLLIDLNNKNQCGCKLDMPAVMHNDESVFFNKFILSWTDSFFSEVIKSDALFYSQISKIASIFLRSESIILTPV